MNIELVQIFDIIRECCKLAILKHNSQVCTLVYSSDAFAKKCTSRLFAVKIHSMAKLGDCRQNGRGAEIMQSALAIHEESGGNMELKRICFDITERRVPQTSGELERSLAENRT